MSHEWNWSDAWIFTAVGVSEKPAQLDVLIAAADGINHAVPTASEINRALNRLHAAGLLGSSRRVFELSAAGDQLFERTVSRGGSLLTVVERLERALRTIPIPGEPRARFDFSDADVSSAHARYVQRLA